MNEIKKFIDKYFIKSIYKSYEPNGDNSISNYYRKNIDVSEFVNDLMNFLGYDETGYNRESNSTYYICGNYTYNIIIALIDNKLVVRYSINDKDYRTIDSLVESIISVYFR